MFNYKDPRYLLGIILALVVGSVFYITQHPADQPPFKLGLDLSGGVRFLLQAKPTKDVPEITPQVMKTLLTVIEKRVNPVGTEENVVQLAGDTRILVEIPGEQDPEQAKSVIGQTGNLEFRAYDPEKQQWIPTGLSGKDLEGASMLAGGGKNWEIDLSFSNEGGDKFFEITRKLAPPPGQAGRNKIGIFFDDELKSDPVVNEPIPGGKAKITGHFSKQEAENIVNILRAGALPVDIEIIDESTVGPLLGKASLEKSLYAGMVGLGLVVFFMLAYYRLPGLFANIALVIYAVFLLAITKMTPSALSLSGIAGMVLSIGMAVDANILIFERTREELRAGRTIEKAIELGFERAFPSIFDSNMTTIITCIILYILGTGLVKGFALNLALGVSVSFFTALVVTRCLMAGFFPLKGQLKHPFLFGLSSKDLPTQS